MRLSYLFLATSLAMSQFAGAAQSVQPATQEPVMNHAISKDNPFLKPSPLEYQAPQFNLYKDSDYEPAILNSCAE